MDNEESYSTNHGKWSQEGVPHKGWTCIDIEDSGAVSFVCEMCESQHIRYIHYMKHPDYQDILSVGCVCAGKMEGNYTKAKLRDDFMKKRAARRLHWIHNSRWKVSQKGNDWIKTDGYIIVMKKAGKLWRAFIKSETGNFEKWSYRQYESKDMAKLAAFDYLTKLLSENQK
jgi:hypothetical protein